MARYAPGSQSRTLIEEKEAVARRLLAAGLSISQISMQLRCSKPFVRRIRDEAGAAPHHLALMP